MTNSKPVRVDETEVFVTRIFNAPRDVVFKFWTDPNHVAKWWGPAGFHNPREDVEIDLRVGGRFQLRMVETATGAEVQVRGTIVELVAPEILAIHLDVPQPIGLPPIEVRVRVQFHDHGDRTRITLHQGPFSTADQREQTVGGWNQSFDALDRLLAATGDEPQL